MSAPLLCKLITDFRQPYDHWFARSDQQCELTFERYMNSGPNRPKMFEDMSNAGLQCPIHGSVIQVSNRLDTSDKVVVYTDILAHCGEGKELCTMAEALESHPELYCSQYIPGSEISYRYLAVGRKHFWLKYESADDWRSNIGNVNIAVIGEMSLQPNRELFDYPLIAIDFVQDSDECLLAIDLNIAPGITGTGIEEFITNKDIASEIISFLAESQT